RHEQQRQGWGPRLVPSRIDGQAVRGRRMGAKTRSDQRPRADAVRLAHHPVHRRSGNASARRQYLALPAERGAVRFSRDPQDAAAERKQTDFVLLTGKRPTLTRPMLILSRSGMPLLDKSLLDEHRQRYRSEEHTSELQSR